GGDAAGEHRSGGVELGRGTGSLGDGCGRWLLIRTSVPGPRNPAACSSDDGFALGAGALFRPFGEQVHVRAPDRASPHDRADPELEAISAGESEEDGSLEVFCDPARAGVLSFVLDG